MCPRAGILIALALVGISHGATAQSFNPIIEENSVDGLLLGAEGSYKFFSWLEPSLGLAYGLSSQAIRYKVGIGLWDGKLSLIDWPRTPILGRIGEAGLKVSLKLPWDLPTVSGFFGTVWPWPHDPNPPDIVYLSWGSDRSVDLPFGMKLGFSSQGLRGWWRLAVSPLSFHYSQTQISLSGEGFHLAFSYGTLENEGGLPDFVFTHGVKGDSSVITGDRFWAVRFERSFEVVTLSVPVPFLPQALELLGQGAVFLQASTAGSKQQDEDEMVWHNRLSWGMSLLLSSVATKARADFVFTRDGGFRFLFSF